MRMPISRSVATRITASFVASILTFCRIGLGLRVGATDAAVWKAERSCSRSHVSFMTDGAFRGLAGRSLFFLRNFFNQQY